MGFYHNIIINQIGYDDTEVADNPPLLVAKHKSLDIIPEENLIYKGGHPLGWEILFNSGMFFTNQKQIKNITDKMYSYLFGRGDEITKKAQEIAEYLTNNTTSCDDLIKDRVYYIIRQMYEVIETIGDLGRSYGLDEDMAYVILNMTDGMEYTFDWEANNTVTRINKDLEEMYSKIITKEKILDKILKNERIK